MINLKTLYRYLVQTCLLAVTFSVCHAKNSEFKISSDSSTLDLPNKIMLYRGHTTFTTQDISIIGDELKVFKKDDESRNLYVIGSPVRLEQNSLSLHQNIELLANNIEYDLNNKNIKAKNNVTLTQKTTDNQDSLKDRYFKVLGDELSFSSDSQGIIQIKGSPLKITISQGQQSPLTATAREMLYNQKTQAFELNGDVFLETDRETIKAEKILYDGKIIQIPESQNQSVQMTQTIKESNE